MNLLQDLISSDLKLYEGVEITIQALLCASVKMSVESVVETVVSRYEKHFNKSRKLNEEQALDEMEISENGPNLFKADPLLQISMDKYWKKQTVSGKWHFVKDSSSSIFEFGSTYGKSTLSLLKSPSKYPVMDK